MTKYITEDDYFFEDIQESLEKGLEEYGTIEKAFDYILEYDIRRLFEMNTYDEPNFTDLIIPFNGINYKIEIKSDGCCEATYGHRIMYWTWIITTVI